MYTAYIKHREEGFKMIQAILKMNFAPKKIAEALLILHSIVERIRTEAGCLSCRVYQDTENKHLVVFEEKWKDEENLQRHLRSDEYQKVLLVMEMALDPPEIHFDTIMASSSLELIEVARSKKMK
jgi:quinol monooxygenase YgiN